VESVRFARDTPMSYIFISHGSNIRYISRSYHNTNPKNLQHFSRLNFPPCDAYIGSHLQPSSPLLPPTLTLVVALAAAAAAAILAA